MKAELHLLKAVLKTEGEYTGERGREEKGWVETPALGGSKRDG